jgi:hypothetical protein
MPRKKRFQTEAQSLTINDRFEGWGKKVSDLLKDVEIPNYKIPLSMEQSTKIGFRQHNYVNQVCEMIFQHNKDKFKSTSDVYRTAHTFGTIIAFHLYLLGGQNDYEKQLYKIFKDMEKELSYSKILDMAQERIRLLVNNISIKIMDEEDIIDRIYKIIDSCPVMIQPTLEQFVKDLVYQSRSSSLFQSYNLSKRHLKSL